MKAPGFMVMSLPIVNGNQLIKEMLDRWIHILSYFSWRDCVILVGGTLVLPFRTERFNILHDKKNKLEHLYLYDRNGFQLTDNNEVLVQLKPNTKSYSCRLRLSGSDVWVFNQVIISKEYEIVLETFKAQFGSLPFTIIDAGANIGLASIFFKMANPDSKILAIEPSHENFTLAMQNIQLNNFTEIELMERALWAAKKNLSIINDFRDKMDWSLRVEEHSEGKVAAITPAEAIHFFGDHVDLFKIDIEGGESQLFRKGNDMSWLFNVKAIAIEIHDELANRREIMDILKSSGFTITTHGELTLGINNNIL